MLTSAELAQLREDMIELLPDTCNVVRLTHSIDDVGNPTATEGTVAANALCRLDPYTRRDERGVDADRESQRDYFRLTLEWDTEVRAGDRVSMGTVMYDIVQIHDDHTLRAVRRLLVARLK